MGVLSVNGVYFPKMVGAFFKGFYPGKEVATSIKGFLFQIIGHSLVAMLHR